MAMLKLMQFLQWMQLKKLINVKTNKINYYLFLSKSW